VISPAEIGKSKKKKFDYPNRNGKKIIAIIGLSKNSGKTTFLNWINKVYPEEERGIITTGRDGEDFDLVGGDKKPKVLIPANTFFSTFPHIAQLNSPFIKIIEKLPFKAGDKTIWLVKSITDLETEIVGPSTVANQIKLCKIILEKGSKQVFIDGSLDRKSILLSPEIQNFYLVLSPEAGSKIKIIEELKKIVGISRIPYTNKFADISNISIEYSDHLEELDFTSLFGHEKELLSKLTNNKIIKRIFIPGAITNRSWELVQSTFIKSDFELVLKNSFNIHLSDRNFNILNKYVELFTQHSVKLLGITVNSFAVSGEHLDCDDLRNSIVHEFSEIDVFDITEVKIRKKKKI